MTATRDALTAARATALFVSGLSSTEQPSRTQVEAAIKNALQSRGGTRGCAAEMAAAFGDYPEVAVRRMCWARGTIESLYRRQQWPARVAATGPIGPHRGPALHGMALAA